MLPAISTRFRQDSSQARSPAHDTSVPAATSAGPARTAASAQPSAAASSRRSLTFGHRLSRNLGSIRRKLGTHLRTASLHPPLPPSRSTGTGTSPDPDASSNPACAAAHTPDPASSSSRSAQAVEPAVSHAELDAPSTSTPTTSSNSPTTAEGGTGKIPPRFRNLFANNGRLHEPGSGNIALYPNLPGLLPLYGTATNTAWTEPMYTIFEQPLPDTRQHAPAEQAAYVGYLLNTPDDKQTYAIAWGNPLCHPDNYAYVAQRWVHKMEADGKRPLWCCCSEDFMDVLTRAHPDAVGDEPLSGPAKLGASAKLDWAALTCIHEDVVDPREFQVDKMEKFVRTKLRKAHRKGLRIVEAHGRFPDPRIDGSSALSRDRVEEGILAWKESKAAKGAQIHASDTEPWRDLTHRKYFYAVAPRTVPNTSNGEDGAGPKKTTSASSSLLAPSLSLGGKSAASSGTNFSTPDAMLEYHEDEKVVGMCVLAPIAEGKYVVKWLLEFDQDVKGTSECLIVHVLERLRVAGSPDWPNPSTEKGKTGNSKGSDGEDKPLSNRDKARRARKARQQAAQARMQQQLPAPNSSSTDSSTPIVTKAAGDAKPAKDKSSEEHPAVALVEARNALLEQGSSIAPPPEGEGDMPTPPQQADSSQLALPCGQNASSSRVLSTASSVSLSSVALFPNPDAGSSLPGSQGQPWDESKRPVCTSVSFGISGGELKPVRNLHVGLRFATITAAYNALSKTFHLASKGSFRTKFGASHEVVAYIAFPQGSLGFKMIDAIVGALKEDQSQATDVEAILGDKGASHLDGSSPTRPGSSSPTTKCDPSRPHSSLPKVGNLAVGKAAA